MATPVTFLILSKGRVLILVDVFLSICTLIGIMCLPGLYVWLRISCKHRQHSLCNITGILYMGKLLRQKTFVVCVVFHSTANLFLQMMALSISNINLQKCYNESFTTNSYFHSKRESFLPWMFSCIIMILWCGPL